MRKLTVKIINSTQANRIGVNETLAVAKRETKGHSGKPRRKPRSNQPSKWFVEFALQMKNFMQRQEQFNHEIRNFMVRQEQFNQEVREFMVRQEQFNHHLVKRLDNIVRLNNLKE